MSKGIPAVFSFFFFNLLIVEREMKEKERETNIYGKEKCLSVASRTCPPQDQTCKPRYVPRLGVEPSIFLVSRMVLQPTESPPWAMGCFLYVP